MALHAALPARFSALRAAGSRTPVSMPVLRRAPVTVCRASRNNVSAGESKQQMMTVLMASSAVAGLLNAGNAAAATELAQLAASDNRIGILATLFVPVVGWVLFNIGGPLLGQLDAAGQAAADTPPEARSLRTKRSVVGPALGLGAAGALMAAQSADAATELAQLAASDNRVGILATLLVPVLGWVLFNIGGPALAQLNAASEAAADTPPEARSLRTKRSVVGPALGLGAAGALMAAQSADAATELAQLAASDNRAGILATLLVPVLGWVLFNIGGPALAQLSAANEVAASTPPEARSFRSKRSVVGPALGLGAAGALMAAQSADAASELAQLAASDNRVAILGTLLLPVLGWVAFNIGGPALAQLAKAKEEADDTPPEKRSFKSKR